MKIEDALRLGDWVGRRNGTVPNLTIDALCFMASEDLGVKVVVRTMEKVLCHHCIEACPAPRRPSCRPPRQVDAKWARLDWDKRDVDLAKDVGVTKERVRQVRAELNKSDSPYKKMSGLSLKLAVKLHEHKHASGRLTDEQACGLLLELAPTKKNIVVTRAACKRAGFLLRRNAVRGRWWQRWAVNWDLTNKDLSEAWGLKQHSFAQPRHDFGLPSAKWDGRNHKRHENHEYRAVLEAERERGRRRFLTEGHETGLSKLDEPNA